jgi:hypothetical protein
VSVCDVAETCSGASGDCPKDSYNSDGSSCTTPNSFSGQCASGYCTSRDAQCQGQGVYNTIKACGSFPMECQLYCEDASGLCIQFNGYFIDGTPCGTTGTCRNGVCNGVNYFQEALAWYRRNLMIAVPVTILIFGILILVIYRSIRYCSARRNQRQYADSVENVMRAPPTDAPRQRPISAYNFPIPVGGQSPNRNTMIALQHLNPEGSTVTPPEYNDTAAHWVSPPKYFK